ncbi:hypothetical protein P9D51_17595 [Bacillus sonorensis]|uniref:hypothetical protein n=1 Tax=Bacillus sonorensis TaxID=119858 RepID=UPI00227E31CE|nr:hypothetical protein [Bacillus sonorensis]MCZ0070727.1 hypothetical protein [Bacillus sonorensis]MCZ0098196.1 hypothetical protein [Bacillus sonorensis]MEC1356446.1 hypothetical protein [Bacillus sonorensis]MEC1427870.1 hypothetical protein [Bacillus sonorensis]MEC1519722.1 hypothetical protein [Bacillus sonorensis]
MKKKTLLLMLAVLFMFTAVWADNAEAVSGTSSSGGRSANTSGKSSAGSRAASVHKNARSYMKNAANKSNSAKNFTKNRVSNSLQRTLPANALYKRSIKQTINQNPAGTSFFNYYFPYWMIFHSHGYTAEQKSMLQSIGVREKEIAKPKENRYWLIIEDQSGKQQAVLVSKKQYDSVNKGDRIKLRHKRLIKEKS